MFILKDQGDTHSGTHTPAPWLFNVWLKWDLHPHMGIKMSKFHDCLKLPACVQDTPLQWAFPLTPVESSQIGLFFPLKMLNFARLQRLTSPFPLCCSSVGFLNKCKLSSIIQRKVDVYSCSTSPWTLRPPPN